MDDQKFLDRVKAKIERLTGVEIRLEVDFSDENQVKVELSSTPPQVTVGSNALKFPGFARMAVEYAVVSIREERELGSLEFHALLARN